MFLDRFCCGEDPRTGENVVTTSEPTPEGLLQVLCGDHCQLPPTVKSDSPTMEVAGDKNQHMHVNGLGFLLYVWLLVQSRESKIAWPGEGGDDASTHRCFWFRVHSDLIRLPNARRVLKRKGLIITK